MSDDQDRTYETSLERIRSAILRAFPPWFCWLISALICSCVTALAWDVFNVFGLKNDEWVSGGRWGAHFSGGKDVLFFLAGVVGAFYSWIRLMFIFRDFICKRRGDGGVRHKQQSEQAGPSDGDKPPC